MLAGKTYAPILHARAVEIRALSELPDATKDLIFPLVVARPWPNAKHLRSTWKKLKEAMGDRRFALDLDHSKYRSGSPLPAADEFDKLFAEEDGFAAYYAEVASVDGAVPTLQIADPANMERQLQAAIDLDRGLVLRLQYGLTPEPLALVQRVLELFEDVAVFIDLGWSDDLLSREVWASTVIKAISDMTQEYELVVAGSSFPESFKSIGRDERLANERVIYENLVKRHNAVIITYGDWGSTRLPKDPIPMGPIPPRIDVPNKREWICFRRGNSRTGCEGQDVAGRSSDLGDLSDRRDCRRCAGQYSGADQSGSGPRQHPPASASPFWVVR
jgi:hypothetical protein